MCINFKKMNNNAKPPYRATEGSAGADLFACIDEEIELKPGERRLIPTGIAIELPDSSCGAFIFPRSSVASKSGVSLANCVGVVDSDYRGAWFVPLINHGKAPFTVEHGMRVAQMIPTRILMPEIEVSDELSETDRGSGGFGSSGI